MDWRDRLARALAAGPPPALAGDLDLLDGAEPPPLAAAVLMAVVERPRPTMLLTLRHAGLRRHAGQVALPGGRIDPGETPRQAALREAQEEVGLPPGEVEVLGEADPYRTGSNYLVTPVVGLVRSGLDLMACEAEVSEIFEMPLDVLLDPARHQPREAEWRGSRRRFYVVEDEGRQVWGATAGMLYNLARRLDAL